MPKPNSSPAPTAQSDAFESDPARETPTSDTIAVPATEAALPEVAREQISTSQNLIQLAEAQAVTDSATYTAASTLLQNMLGVHKKLETERLGITRPMDAAKERVMALFRPRLTALESAGKILRAKLTAYDAEQQRIADEARRKAEEEAARLRREQEAKERAERERAEQQRREAERQRQEKEAAEQRRRDQEAAAERARLEEEQARARGEAEAAERARLEREQAEAAAAAEREKEAEAARAAANADRNANRAEARAEVASEASTSIVAPIIETEQPRVEGIARRLEWKAEVTDLMQVVKAVAEGKAPLALLQANDKVIGQQARSLQKEFQVPGIRVWSQNTIAARSR